MADLTSFMDIGVGSVTLICIIAIHGFLLERISDYFTRNYSVLKARYSMG